jgi:hypothetical protein
VVSDIWVEQCEDFICPRATASCQDISFVGGAVGLCRLCYEDVLPNTHGPASRRCSNIFTRSIFLSPLSGSRAQTIGPGQEDIESLEKSIGHFANRLPQDVTGVGLISMFTKHSSTSLGSGMPDVCSTSPWTKYQGLYLTSAQYAKMYIGN